MHHRQDLAGFVAGKALGRALDLIGPWIVAKPVRVIHQGIGDLRVAPSLSDEHIKRDAIGFFAALRDCRPPL